MGSGIMHIPFHPSYERDKDKTLSVKQNWGWDCKVTQLITVPITWPGPSHQLRIWWMWEGTLLCMYQDRYKEGSWLAQELPVSFHFLMCPCILGCSSVPTCSLALTLSELFSPAVLINSDSLCHSYWLTSDCYSWPVYSCHFRWRNSIGISW